MEKNISNSQLKLEIKKFDKIALWTLIFGVIFLVATPYIFTQNFLFERFDFTEMGNIGSTIGGITAPFMSLIGSILVYLSFRMQSKMNVIQFVALDKQFARMDAENMEKNFAKVIENLKLLKDNYSQEYKDSVGKVFGKVNDIRNTIRSGEESYLKAVEEMIFDMSLFDILISLGKKIASGLIVEEDKETLYIQMYLYLHSIDMFKSIEEVFEMIETVEENANHRGFSTFEFIGRISAVKQKLEILYDLRIK